VSEKVKQPREIKKEMNKTEESHKLEKVTHKSGKTARLTKSSKKTFRDSKDPKNQTNENWNKTVHVTGMSDHEPHITEVSKKMDKASERSNFAPLFSAKGENVMSDEGIFSPKSVKMVVQSHKSSKGKKSSNSKKFGNLTLRLKKKDTSDRPKVKGKSSEKSIKKSKSREQSKEPEVNNNKEISSKKAEEPQMKREKEPSKKYSKILSLKEGLSAKEASLVDAYKSIKFDQSSKHSRDPAIPSQKSIKLPSERQKSKKSDRITEPSLMFNEEEKSTQNQIQKLPQSQKTQRSRLSKSQKSNKSNISKELSKPISPSIKSKIASQKISEKDEGEYEEEGSENDDVNSIEEKTQKSHFYFDKPENSKINIQTSEEHREASMKYGKSSKTSQKLANSEGWNEIANMNGADANKPNGSEYSNEFGMAPIVSKAKPKDISEESKHTGKSSKGARSATSSLKKRSKGENTSNTTSSKYKSSRKSKVLLVMNLGKSSGSDTSRKSSGSSGSSSSDDSEPSKPEPVGDSSCKKDHLKFNIMVIKRSVEINLATMFLD
jgi:hypothetical protein